MSPTDQPHEYGEDAAVEQPAIQLFDSLGWQTANLYHEWAGGKSTEGRESEKQVILEERLRTALERLNPELPAPAIVQAIEEITRDRSRMVPVNANHELWKLMREGVKVKVAPPRGGQETRTARVIDWRNPAANDFLLASQLWVKGDMYRRRPDLVGFVNGIPLLLVELKKPSVALKSAYDGNITDYRNTVPHLFTPNAFVLLSNGLDTKVGSTFAPWQFFNEWKRIDDEEEAGRVSLETAIRGLCEPSRLLDLIENFIVYEEEKAGLVKKLAKNHQFLGVNAAIQGVVRSQDRPEGEAGRLGVFWHTQGSGKSLSMVFFCQKILRTVPGNWTFVIVTDRQELDEQLYKTFLATGAVTNSEAHAQSGAHLKQLLSADHRYVFTLIQKFNTRDGAAYPQLSDRRDIIVITDEAHRSQYDALALNMRNALPNAAFLGFTGTPLMAGEERTREVFGDYVSVYNFAQSIADGATVPLYYENRIPELQLTNGELGGDLEDLLEEADLDEDQARKVEREFAREYHLITRDDRLDAIASDLVRHFVGRGLRSKAMMVCIDKATAVKMHDKVRAEWKCYQEELQTKLATAKKDERPILEAQVALMASTDMAVVVSQSQNEIKELADKGLDIRPHRKRLVEEDLDERFKDANDPLRLVFVCAMWITGFDVPSCSTIYLDKPMKNHTLMQTIARANRNFPGKEAGFIVDYVGVFRNLQKALAIYGGGNSGSAEPPIRDKSDLIEHLRHRLAETLQFMVERDVVPSEIKQAQGLEKVALVGEAVEKLIETDEAKRQYLGRARAISRIYKAILPDRSSSEFAPDVVLITVLAERIRSLMPKPDISAIMQDVEDLLDRSVAPIPYETPENPEVIDISQIDFDKLREKFDTGKQRTEAERLRSLLSLKLTAMVTRNPTRADFLDRFQQLIDSYNTASQNTEAFFRALLELAEDLSKEERQTVREGLSEEEKAVFDILTKPVPELTDKEREQVKAVARSLLRSLKDEKLVLDWTKKEQGRGAVRKAIEVTLDRGLPDAYDEDLFNRKCDTLYRHIFDAYQTGREGIYAAA
ncbi:Type I restriction enzyme EcoR124II R protein [Pseudooceanicola marinus]|uniref:Type I restriction enzyme endonuclease subunit n=1 Tax=Pseudooceanicola marinus TaxID=396013 RepID=A0A1X7ABF3_9RHOB|nr:type I restriction endonuclease subunit R [Pseudooceanicola marinus]PJE33760.1 type I restriction endonuclease subunit R [Pseudooceanicola marinus]SLN75113.1 Type I restriction enzyme EcoR124II R protein [Pseudooceanicola marinus]